MTNHRYNSGLLKNICELNLQTVRFYETIEFSFLPFYLSVWMFAYIHICALCSCPVPEMARRGSEQPCRCWQGTESRSYAEAANTLNFLAISPASVFTFYHVYMSLGLKEITLGYVKPCHNKQRGARERDASVVACCAIVRIKVSIVAPSKQIRCLLTCL